MRAYRHGVLIGNWNEDKFGLEHAHRGPRPWANPGSTYTGDVGWKTPSDGTSGGKGIERGALPKAMTNVQGDLLFGHLNATGRQEEDFSRREFTSNNRFFYQPPGLVFAGSLSSNRYCGPVEPTTLQSKRLPPPFGHGHQHRDGMGFGHLVKESREQTLRSSYTRFAEHAAMANAQSAYMVPNPAHKFTSRMTMTGKAALNPPVPADVLQSNTVASFQATAGGNLPVPPTMSGSAQKCSVKDLFDPDTYN
uniref:Uncharacterized protein n=1 Tax=Chromera velia CCMP2878 TaxID=1169474 RepID=A0A0G4F1V0_9ALVE|eukprot:Cvel_14711.t1-p1 / transcript=Cvel_14711.t1 / gene=Cvel_14711 / organism=Chromera_velia_CCMP2878 / gene_product=hypothetical protein / transcript_product=hypothetical protein / location=Cvel_scaffold1057:4183-8449(-) / protein_length=249 / sequence_SO=supercontig / SO=protein_coding / is_pseudo=false